MRVNDTGAFLAFLIVDATKDGDQSYEPEVSDKYIRLYSVMSNESKSDNYVPLKQCSFEDL